MTKRIFAVAMVSVLGLIAQEPEKAVIAPYGGTWEQLRQFLTLTDPQVSTLDQIRQNRAQQERALYDQIADKQRQMWDLLQNGSNDALAVGRLMVDVNNLQRRLPLRGDTYRAEVLAQLTPAQKAKLPALTDSLSLQSAAWQAIDLNMIDNPVVPDIRMLPAPLGAISAAEPNRAPAAAARNAR